MESARNTRRMVAVAALALAGCSSATPKAYGPAIGPTAIPGQQVVSQLSSRSVGRLGQLVSTAAGYTAYANAQERVPGAGCDAVCRRTWPLLLAPATGATAATGATSTALIGVTRLAGLRVLTYGGHVLHVYVGDSGPGGAAGQNVQGVWAAVTVAGTPARGVP